MKKYFSIITIFLLIINHLFSQSVNLSYSGNNNYILTERTDLRRYDNNRYTGLTSKEVKSFISPDYNEDTQNYIYYGDFYVNQDTKRANINVNNGIHDSIPSVFTINNLGQMTVVEDYGYPSFRSFPTFPKEEIKIGESWEGESLRAVDPLDDGNITVIPMYVRYTYVKDEYYNNQEVYLLKAEWATRYGGFSQYIDVNGDSNLSSATGKHSANIYISKENGAALVIRDTVDENFVYKDKTTVAFKGTITLFTEYPSTVNEEKLLPVINRIAEQNDIEYEKTTNGIRLIIKDLQFVADSSELLPGEEKRLNVIAGLLKQITTNQFLVEGHTARVGDESNEMGLSLERAHSIVNELVKRGVSSENFICKGSGGTKPIADNSTEEGRATNRRVEITILY